MFLLTNNHILDKNSIKIGNDIIFDHKNKPVSNVLEISNNRRTFTNEELDYTCIEIFEKDKIFENDEIKRIFKIDQNILENNISSMENIDIFILQYPLGNELSFSEGKIVSITEEKIQYTASTNHGSSGSPIIKRDNYCVIGLHVGSEKKKIKTEICNFGLNIIAIINDIKKNISQKENFIKDSREDLFNIKNEKSIKNEKKETNQLIWIKKKIAVYDIKNKELSNKIKNSNEGSKIYGFINKGNDSYLNSSLQLLTRIKELKDGVFNYEKKYKINEDNDTEGKLFIEFKKMLNLIENSKKSIYNWSLSS